MKLTLDHTQRLNLHALLGAQRADVGAIRAIWGVQDKIALDAEEEKTLAVTREITNGLERFVWNPALSIPAREFELVDAEVARLKAALATWDSYAAGGGRPSVATLFHRLFFLPFLCFVLGGHCRAVDSGNGGICAQPDCDIFSFASVAKKSGEVN